MTVSTTDTIAALATPPGESGIAVVRVSGEGALALLDRVLRTPAGRPFDAPWEHRRLHHAAFVGPDGARIDDVMVAVMRAPESYTGDDVAEISCHGGPAVISRILETLFSLGARPAGPGEFTRRAFLNGKMDLIQAEAVADLIHARTELQRVVAERQLGGALSRRIDALADDLLGLIGLIEANIDFIEEDIDVLDVPGAQALVARQQGEIADLLASAAFARPLRDGVHVVVAGPVNAGKSSLFNRLVGEARAIVTDIPGTTRDVLRETIAIDGVPFVFHDTAGLRGAAVDPVETIGMDRARDAARDADIVVFVVDGSVAPEADTRSALEALDASRSIVVVNKRDAGSHPGWAVFDPAARVITTSVVTGEGIDAVREAIRRIAGTDTLSRMARERTVLTSRLVSLLGSARECLLELARLLEGGSPLEILAAQAREALACYEEATGRRYHDGLLDVIFSRFCIGK